MYCLHSCKYGNIRKKRLYCFSFQRLVLLKPHRTEMDKTYGDWHCICDLCILFLVETFYSIKRSNVLIEQRFLNFITDVLEPVHWF